MSEAVDVLNAILDEIRGLREDVQALRGDKFSDLSEMEAAIERLGDKITGPLNYSLEDLQKELADINTNTA